MGVEIERKFRVSHDGWRGAVTASRRIVQGYLARGEHSVIRVRIVNDARAVITVKGRDGTVSRAEYEWEIPVADAREVLDMAEGVVIEKVRHIVPQDDLAWEIDVFERPRPLTLAEIELPDEDTTFARPDWLGDEVTADPAFSNATMAMGTDPRHAED